MLRIAFAEVHYNLVAMLAWFIVLLVAVSWPFLEVRSISEMLGALPLVIFMLSVLAPAAAAVINSRLLSVEHIEKRLRLFSALPLSWTQLAVARLLRTLAPIALTLLLIVILVLVGLTLEGPGFLSSLGSSWALITALLAGVALLALQLLLVDLTSSVFAQVFSAAVIAFLFFNPWAEQFREHVLVPVAELAETPPGALLALVLCLVFAAADVLVFRRRSSLRFPVLLKTMRAGVSIRLAAVAAAS